MILSASRRTDIPAFYGNWLMNRLRAGFLLVRNPRNPRQVSRIDLSPENVDCIVFWTKNPAPFLSRLSELDARGIPYYFQFTLTPYGPELEPGLPDKSAVADIFRRLADRLGTHRVLWRFDPILLNADWDVPRILDAFARLCRRLAGYTEQCTISFLDVYAKVRPAVRSGRIRPPQPDDMAALANTIGAIGGEAGLDVRACCEEMDWRPFGIRPASCISRERVERVCGCPIQAKLHNGQRPHCGCVDSVDIGAYDTCRNGCVYCYANAGGGAVAAACARHDPLSPLLTGRLLPDDVVRSRPGASLRQNQTTLY
ncbi:DUF1848 domain-containing protein [Anaeromassilibacillus sp. SJQ-5]